MNEKVLVGPKFGTLTYRKWVTNIWVVTTGYESSDSEVDVIALLLPLKSLSEI
jgi:hypothetical protein